MAIVDLVDIIEQRIAQIEEDDEFVGVEDTYFDSEKGIWCLLTLFDEALGELMGLEFIETAESWRRPEAILEYNEAASEEIMVLVVVPDESFVEMSELLARAGNPMIHISDYSAMEFVPHVLVG